MVGAWWLRAAGSVLQRDFLQGFFGGKRVSAIESVFDRLADCIGVAMPQVDLNEKLKLAVRELNAPAVGIHHVTCSDEAERETIESLQRALVADFAPRLPSGNCSAFRTATLGARYEPGSLMIAEGNFSGAGLGKSGKLLIIKINAHVGVLESDGQCRYGFIERYGREASACGALRALLAGASGLFADQLREQFGSDGKERLAALRELPEEIQLLATAVVSTRLQARDAVADALAHTPAGPTSYIVLPTVTVHGREANAEILCGISTIGSSDAPAETYRCLGDDPAKYTIAHEGSSARIQEDGGS